MKSEYTSFLKKCMKNHIPISMGGSTFIITNLDISMKMIEIVNLWWTISTPHMMMSNHPSWGKISELSDIHIDESDQSNEEIQNYINKYLK